MTFVVVLMSMMLLVFALAGISSVSSEPYLRNASTTTTANSNTTSFGDSELSASERNRRLIPYMAYYVPQQDFPINQQYLAQRPKTQQPQSQKSQQTHPQQQQISGLPAGSAAQPQSAIPIPTAYVHMNVPAAIGNPHHQQQPYHPHHHHQSPQQHQLDEDEVYQTIVYSGQHPLSSLKEGKKPISPALSPLSHLVPPGPDAAVATSANPLYKDSNLSQHKSVVVYQPQPQPPYHQQYQQQTQTNHQQQSQSKINLTPFTPTNIVPGHFIPIIYSPNEQQKLQQKQQQGNTINYNSKASPEAITGSPATEQMIPKFGTKLKPHHHHQQQQQQQLSYQDNPHHYPHHQIGPLNAASDANNPSADGQQQEPHIHVQFVSVTPTPTPSNNPLYHVINDEAAVKQNQQQQHQIHYDSPKAPQAEHFYDQIQFLNSPNATPQQKYVAYLKQQMQYKQQQQQREREREEQYKAAYHQQQQQSEQQQQKQHHQHQVFVVSSTQSPPPPSAASPLSPSELSIDGSSAIHPHHSPIGHAVHQRPQIAVPPNHQRPQSYHQILQRPESSTSQNQGRYEIIAEVPEQQHPQQQLVPHYTKSQSFGPSSSAARQPIYIEYIIDDGDSKQNIGEELPRQRLPSPTSRPSLFMVTTSSPNAAPGTAPSEIIASSPRPAYKSQPTTLHLQPVAPTNLNAAHFQQQQTHHQQGMRPIHPPSTQSIFTPRPFIAANQESIYHDNDENERRVTPSPAAAPQLVYVSAKPKYNQEFPSAAPDTVPKHPYNFEPSVKISTPQEEMIPPPPPPGRSMPIPEQYEPQSPRVHSSQQQQQQYHRRPSPAEQYQRPIPSHSSHSDDQLPDIRTSSLAEILHKLQESNHLPQTLTPDNIDNSIRTLITILNNLKQSQTIVDNPPQHHEDSPSPPHEDDSPTPPSMSHDYDYPTGSEEERKPITQDLSIVPQITPIKKPGPNTGRPGIDYPNYSEIPKTSFDCGEQRYKGFFGDTETNCQVWHYCDLNGGKASFLCPNGTIFSQIALTCDWWFNVKCSSTPQLYVLNERLYKYILPFTPKFPEDYSGPLVDKYLALKFQEMEEKMRREKLEKQMEEEEGNDKKPNHIDNATTMSTVKHTKHASINSQVGEQSSEKNLLIDDELDESEDHEHADTHSRSSSTSSSLPPTTLSEELPLSLKPIVVSTTALPEFRQKEIEEAEAMANKSSGDDERQRSNSGESSKISVEKVEVIEIKSDGSTGHLTPDMLNETKK